MSRDFRRLPVLDALARARDGAFRCFDLAAQRPNEDATRGERYPGHAMLCGVTTRMADIDVATPRIPPWV